MNLQKVRRESRLEDDCLVLLKYVSEHPGEYQTEKMLGRAVNLSQQRISVLLRSVRGGTTYDKKYGVVSDYGPSESCLLRTASKYGFRVTVYQHRRRGRLVDVIYDGRALVY